MNNAVGPISYQSIITLVGWMNSQPCLDMMKKVKTSHSFCTHLFLLFPHHNDEVSVLPHQPHSPANTHVEDFKLWHSQKWELRWRHHILSSTQSSIIYIVKISCEFSKFDNILPPSKVSSPRPNSPALVWSTATQHRHLVMWTSRATTSISNFCYTFKPILSMRVEKSSGNRQQDSWGAVKDKGRTKRSEKRKICLK